MDEILAAHRTDFSIAEKARAGVKKANVSSTCSTIRFFASGMSCGGAIALTRLGVGYEIRVNWLTGEPLT